MRIKIFRGKQESRRTLTGLEEQKKSISERTEKYWVIVSIHKKKIN